MKNKRDFALWLSQQLDIKANMSFMTQLGTVKVFCYWKAFSIKILSLKEVFLSGYSMINVVFIRTNFIDCNTKKFNDLPKHTHPKYE